MPKYYIQNGVERTVVDASQPIEACVKACRSGRLPSVLVGGVYILSERGFDRGTLRLSSDTVNLYLLRYGYEG